MRSLLFCVLFVCSFQLGAQIVFDSVYPVPTYPGFGRNIEPANNGYLVNAFVDNGYSNTLLYRLNSIGDTLWTKRYGEDTVQYKTYDMQRCADGSYLLCGDFQRQSTYPNMDSYLMKIDSAANVVWFNKFGIPFQTGGGKDYANNIAVFPNGTIITTGQAKHSYTEVGTIQNYSLFQGYIHLFDSLGDSIRAISVVHCFEPSSQTWDKIYSCNDVGVIGNKACIVGHRADYLAGPSPGDSYALIVDQNLDTVASVYFPAGTNMYSVDATAHGTFLVYGYDLLSEIDTNGVVLWQRQININSFRHTKVAARQNGEIVLLESGDGGDIAYTVANSNISSSQGKVILHTLDSTGQEICADTISNALSSTIACVDFHLEGDSLITLTGGKGAQGLWIVQYSGRCRDYVGINEPEPTLQLNLYPNPAFEIVTVSGIRNGARISIWNSLGQLVYEQVAGDQSDLVLNISVFSAGVYTVTSTNDDGIVYKARLIKQ